MSGVYLARRRVTLASFTARCRVSSVISKGEVRTFADFRRGRWMRRLNWYKTVLIIWLTLVGVMLAVVGGLDDAPGAVLIALVSTPALIFCAWKA